MSKPAPDQDDAWIEKVAELGGKLGFNKMRLRWKLIRWQERRRQTARRREQQVQHITYAHKTCPQCGAVQDKDEPQCASCGAKLGKRGLQVLGRLGVMAPEGLSVSTVLALAILFAYAKIWIAMGGGFGGPSAMLLYDLGARWPPAMADEPWRVFTPVFLHIGWWHLAFNLLAIASIGPRIEERYGRGTMLGLFVVTGVLANLGSLQVGPLAVGAGASGGVMGLIGVAAGSGHREGTGRGRELRNDMLKWSAYTFIFGFALNADNWAHLFGGLAGAVFGFALTPAMWRRRVLFPARVLMGLVGAATTIAALAIIFTRQPASEASIAAADRAVLRDYIQICKRHRAGDMPGAIDAAKRYLTASGEGLPIDEVTTHDVEATCASIEEMRAACRTGQAPPETCELYRRAFDEIPPE